MKQNVKRLGFFLTLALLCAVMFTGAALAEEWLDVRLASDYLASGDTLEVNFDKDGKCDQYKLYITRLGDGLEPLDVSATETDDGFELPVDDLGEMDRGYRVTVEGTKDNELVCRGYREFLVASEAHDFDLRVEIEGLDDEGGLLLNQNATFRVYAEDAQRVWLSYGDGGEDDISGDRDRSYRRFWDWEHDALVYVRAEYRIPYSDQVVSAISAPKHMHIRSDHDPLPALSLEFKDGPEATRGDIVNIGVSINGDVPEDAQELRMAIYAQDEDGHWVYDEEFDWTEDEIGFPTAMLPQGEYQVGGFLRAVGYPHQDGNQITLNVNETDPFFTVEKTEAVPHEWYMISAYMPEAEGLCIFCGDRIEEEWHGQNSFVWYDSYDRQGVFEYTLGVWDSQSENWVRTDHTRTVTINRQANDDDLPGIDMTVTNSQEETLTSGAVIGEGESINIVLSPLDENALEACGRDIYSVWYDVYVVDISDDHRDISRVNGNLESLENDFTPFTLDGQDLEPGHIYEITGQAHVYGFEVREQHFLFTVSNGQEEGFLVQLRPKDDDTLDINDIIPNQVMDVYIEAPADVTAVQLFQDGNWSWEPLNWDRHIRTDGDGHPLYAWWEGELRLNDSGQQLLIARGTSLDTDEDEDIDWNEVDWDYTSQPLAVNVREGDFALVPAIEIVNREINRGDFLKVRLLPEYDGESAAQIQGILDTVDGFNMEIKRLEGEDDWQHVMDEDRFGDDIAIDNWNNPLFSFPTMTLEPGATYRVVLHAIGARGYRDDEGPRNDPDCIFTVNQTEERGLTAYGYMVKYDEDVDCYTAPTCAEYFVSGYGMEDEKLALFRNDEYEGEWNGAFTWRGGWEDEPRSNVYKLRPWNDGADDWGEPVAQITVDSVLFMDAEELGETVVTVHTGDDVNIIRPDEDFTISFPLVENAEFCNVEVRLDGHDHPVLEWRDIREHDEWLPTGVSIEDGQVFINANLSSLYDLETGDFCKVSVHAYRFGSKARHADLRALVMKGEDDDLTLEISPVDDGDDIFYVNKDFRLTIITGRENVSAVQVFVDGEWRMNGVDERIEPEEPGDPFTYIVHESAFDEGEQQVLVRVTEDDFDWDDFDEDDLGWSDPSNACAARFMSKGLIHLPDITLDNHSVIAGDMIKVTFGPLEDLDKVRRFNVQVFDANDPDNWGDRAFEDHIAPGNGDYWFSTANLWPGDYCLFVNMDVEEGYSSDGTDRRDESLWFHVDPLEGAPFLTVTDLEGNPIEPNVEIGQNYVVTGAMPGWRGSIAIFEVDSEDRDGPCAESDGRSTVSINERWDNSGTHEYQLFAWDGYEEEWTHVDGCDLTVTVKEGQPLDPPTLSFERQDNGDYEIAAIFDKNAKYYAVRAFRGDDWEDQVYPRFTNDRFEFMGANEEGEHSFTIEADALSIGERYTIVAWCGAPGYEGIETRKRFTVTGEQDDSITLTVNNGEALDALDANKDYPIRIAITGHNEENPDRIQLFWEDDWHRDDWIWPGEGMSYFAEDGYVFQQGADECNFTAVVRAAWDVPENASDEEVNWVYSNPVEVNFVANGKVSLPSAEVILREDDKLTLHLSGLNDVRDSGAEDVHAMILSRDTDDEWHWQCIDIINDYPQDFADVDIDLTKLFIEYDNPEDTWAIGPGRFRVHLHVNGPEGVASNWTNGDDEKLWFEIPGTLKIQTWDAEAEDWADCDSDNITVSTRERFNLVAQTPAGVKYCVNDRYDETEFPEDEHSWSWRSENLEDNTFRKWDWRNNSGDYPIYLSYYDEDRDEWVRDESIPEITVHVRAEHEKLVLPKIEAPATVPSDAETLSYSFNAVPSAEIYGLWVAAIYPDEDEEELFAPDIEIGEPLPEGVTLEDGVYTCTFPVEAGRLREGGKVQFYVYVAAKGFDADETSREAPIVGEMAESETPWLTIDDADESLNALSRQELHYKVRIPLMGDESPRNPERVQIYLDEWRELDSDDDVLDWDTDDYTDLAFTNNWLESGVHSVQLRATWDEGDDDEVKWLYGNTVRVVVTGKDIEPPQVSLTVGGEALDERHRVHRGRMVEVSFEWPEHVKGCDVKLYCDENLNDQIYHRYTEAGTAIGIPTDYLAEGEDYWVEVWFETEPGFNSTSTRNADEEPPHFHLIQGNSSFEASAAQVMSKEEFTLSAYVPGADRLRFVSWCGDDGDYDEEPRENGGGDNLYEYYDIDRAGTYTFQLEQWNDGEWSVVDDDNLVNPITVNVTSVGAIARPVINLPSVLTRDADGAFTVTVDTDPDPMAKLNVEVRENDSDDDRPIWSIFDAEERAFTLPMDMLEEGQTYRVNVYAWYKGYDCFGSDQEIEILPPMDDTLPTLHMTVNGKTGTIRVPSSTDYTVAFEITPPEGHDRSEYDIESLEIKWDDDWRNMSTEEGAEREYTGDAWSGSFINGDDECVRPLTMRARINGEYVYCADTVNLIVEAMGKVPDPQATLSGLNEYGFIEQDQNVGVTITLPEATEDNNRDKITCVDLNLKTENDNGEYHDHVWGMRVYTGNPTDNTLTASIPTSSLEPGTRYRVEIWVGAEEGYDSGASDQEDQNLYFTVTGKENRQPVLTVSKNEVEIGEDFALSGSLPDEGRLAIVQIDNNHEDVLDEGDTTVLRTHNLQWPGEYTFTLAVWFGGSWKKLTNAEASVTVTVKETDKQLDDPALEATDAILDEAYSFTFHAVADADRYYVHVYKPNDDWNHDVLLEQTHEANKLKEVDGGRQLTLTIPWSAFSMLDAQIGDEFEIYVESKRQGYKSGQTTQMIAVAYAPEALTAPGAAEIGEAFTVTVSVPEAESIALMRNGVELATADHYTATFTVTENEPGVYTYTVMADGSESTLDPIEVIVTHAGSAEAPATLLTLPGGLNKVEYEAFYGAGIQGVVIPDGCEAIETRAFASCASLQYVVIPASVRSIAADAFTGCDSLVTIIRNE